MEVFIDLLKALILFIVIVIAITPICTRMDKIILQLGNIQKSIISEVEYE